jgi:hypothetical protein
MSANKMQISKILNVHPYGLELAGRRLNGTKNGVFRLFVRPPNLTAASVPVVCVIYLLLLKINSSTRRPQVQYFVG